jgi:hypothetical protein
LLQILVFLIALRRRRAQIAGLELRELNALERELLLLLDFRLAVRRDEYDACAAGLATMRVPAATPSGRSGPSNAGTADADAARIAPARPEQCAAAGAAQAALGTDGARRGAAPRLQR